MSARLRRAGGDLAYLTIGGVTATLALAAWVAGVSLSLSLAVFVVGIPVFAAWAMAFRWLAGLDRRNAARVLGAPLDARYREGAAGGLAAQVRATVTDPQTWRDLSWLVVHSVIGLAFATIALTGAATAAGLAVLPLWYWSLPEGAEVGLWTVESLGGAFATAPLAIPVAAVTVVAMRAMALAEAGLASLLLGPRAAAPVAVAAAPPVAPAPRARRDHAQDVMWHATVAALVGLLCTLLWALTSRGYFWPAGVWLGLLITVSLHVLFVRALAAAGDPEQALRVKAELTALLAFLCLAVWALAGGGYFWPVWPMLGMGAPLAARVLYVYRRRLPWLRERALARRVDELTRTRRGALDVQAAELRRIERDLHDGAQARLVSLSMLIGRAEERLGGQPEVAALVRQAREEAGAAIGELRDLARGIAPPILADRGLAAAVEALASRAPMDVTVTIGDPGRPPPVVETAAYFVAAEALTNVAKHGGGAPAHVTIDARDGMLVVEVRDQGPGGADAGGSGLAGLRSRVEALDGELSITSPAGGGTTIRAELPCGS